MKSIITRTTTATKQEMEKKTLKIKSIVTYILMFAFKNIQ